MEFKRVYNLNSIVFESIITIEVKNPYSSEKKLILCLLISNFCIYNYKFIIVLFNTTRPPLSQFCSLTWILIDVFIIINVIILNTSPVSVKVGPTV